MKKNEKNCKNNKIFIKFDDFEWKKLKFWWIFMVSEITFFDFMIFENSGNQKNTIFEKLKNRQNLNFFNSKTWNFIKFWWFSYIFFIIFSHFLNHFSFFRTVQKILVFMHFWKTRKNVKICKIKIWKTWFCIKIGQNSTSELKN